MEPSEASSVPTNPTNDSQNDDASSALQPSLPSSNGDPDLDPAPTDLDHAVQGVGEIEGQFGKMGLKENIEENEEVVESGVKEKEEEDGAEGDSDGGERQRKKENGKREEEESDGGENENENENGSEVEVEGNGDELEKNNEGGGSNRRNQYPVRPEAEDCSFYLKTGTCKFGSNCKFNHPVRRKNNQVAKEKVKEQEELPERPGQTECKYYLRSGGCKFGKACRYNHTKGKTTAASVLELNFVGLPIRMGEKECPYYMRTGSCKYGANCRFNHPDPTASGGSDPSSGYGNGGPVSLPGAPQSPIASWSSPRSLNETAPFVPMMLSPTQGVPQNSEWNGYQAPVYLPPERNLPPPPPPPYVMNNPVTESNIYTHHQPLKQIEEFPERPGQPECSYFIKTGDCKFKSNCKYHHPKNRTTMSNQIALSDKGLPLRPDQNICTYYSRYGICKFGPACKFDHSVHPPASNISGLGHQHPYGDSATMERAGTAGSRNRSDSTIQQPV